MIEYFYFDKSQILVGICKQSRYKMGNQDGYIEAHIFHTEPSINISQERLHTMFEPVDNIKVVNDESLPHVMQNR